jgi:hypothetical protein
MADAHHGMAGPLRHIDDRAPICESGATRSGGHLPSPAPLASVGIHRPTGARHGEAYKENLGEAEQQPQYSELEKMGEKARSR